MKSARSIFTTNVYVVFIESARSIFTTNVYVMLIESAHFIFTTNVQIISLVIFMLTGSPFKIYHIGVASKTIRLLNASTSAPVTTFAGSFDSVDIQKSFDNLFGGNPSPLHLITAYHGTRESSGLLSEKIDNFVSMFIFMFQVFSCCIVHLFIQKLYFP